MQSTFIPPCPHMGSTWVCCAQHVTGCPRCHRCIQLIRRLASLTPALVVAFHSFSQPVSRAGTTFVTACNPPLHGGCLGRPVRRWESDASEELDSYVLGTPPSEDKAVRWESDASEELDSHVLGTPPSEDKVSTHTRATAAGSCSRIHVVLSVRCAMCMHLRACIRELLKAHPSRG